MTTTNCLNWCAMGAKPVRVADVPTKNQWQKLVTFKKSITVVAKQDAWAKIEGEGDLSLAYWRKVHIDFFNKYFPDFQETDWLELNEFVVI